MLLHILGTLIQLACSDDQHETYHNDRPNLALIPLDPLRPEQICWFCQAGCCMFSLCWYRLFAVTTNTKLTTMTGQIWHWFHLTHLDLSKSVDFESVKHVVAYSGDFDTACSDDQHETYHNDRPNLALIPLDPLRPEQICWFCQAGCCMFSLCWYRLFAVTINAKLTTMTGQIWHWFHLTHLDLSKLVDFESVKHVVAYFVDFDTVCFE